ncbi:MFS general substrate transporter [Suillus fuscotomentosus]|uniref:MFS general substrate transporter n=1 Tax=Suillus fuscotomentosus TaxID=1912939 RepID=A0AAD4HSN4_9AGAM|nr:MFS general substrate transporter [Suillus fuscotomentosus]KAG1907317.1 MFS general substrate transporter [Suillus fuscotomentosus]
MDPEKETSHEEIADSPLFKGDEALRLVGTQAQKFNEEYNRRLRNKLDKVIIPITAAVYFTQFLDKTSLNYASIMGFPVTGQNYNLVSMAFYLGFIVWEFPTVYIAQKLRLGKYLGVNVIIWGIVLLCHAFADSFHAFFALRFILGMCESCVSPILISIISMFYRKNEQGTRIAYFYAMLGFTQVFGGFVAYGISFYNGGAMAPYKIVYYLLGGLAILVGIIVLVCLPDSPVNAWILTEEERIASLERVRDDQGGTENRKFKKEQVIETLLDVRTWLIVPCNYAYGGLTNFSNIIIKNFGYTSRQTLILATPSGIVEVISVVVCGYYSDKKGERMLPVIYATLPTLLGVGKLSFVCSNPKKADRLPALMIGFNDSGQKGVLLFGSYLIGSFGSTLSTIYAYNASNTSGYTKKLTLNALTMVFFCVGNIIGTEIFQPKDAPAYIPGKAAIMVLLSAQIGVAYLLRHINVKLNIKRRAIIEEIKREKGWTDDDVQKEKERRAFADMTDKQ